MHVHNAKNIESSGEAMGAHLTDITIRIGEAYRRMEVLKLLCGICNNEQM